MEMRERVRGKEVEKGRISRGGAVDLYLCIYIYIYVIPNALYLYIYIFIYIDMYIKE